jgi:sugar phosphate isomerase/epimerase
MIPAGAAIFASRTVAAPIPRVALTKAGFAIAIQCWSFREFTLFEAMQMASSTGAGGVELFPGQKIGGPLGEMKISHELADDVIATIRAELAKHGLAACNYGVTEISKDEAAARKVFEFAKKMDLYGISTESLDAIVTLEKLAREFDIKVCFHNHPKPSALWHPDTVWKIIAGRHANLGYSVDTGHWATSGLDPLATIRKIAPRVPAFHLKDREVIGQASPDRPFGTGIIDIPALLDEARKHGFAGNVSIEYEHNEKNNLPEIAQCVGYLRGYANLRG